MRADRILSVERVEGREPLEPVDLDHWFDTIERDDGSGLPLRILVTQTGMKNFDLRSLFRDVRETTEGGLIEGIVPRSEIGWFASQLLPVGLDVTVESPPELIAAMRAQAMRCWSGTTVEWADAGGRSPPLRPHAPTGTHL